MLTAQTPDRRLALGDSSKAQSAAGTYYALVIGNNAYQNVRRLKTAEDDAKEVDVLLRAQYGFQTRLLLNATRQQIISALNTCRRELDPRSNLLIYYAGHGYNDREIDKAYWLPVDARQDDNSNWISADDITSNIRGIPAKHVLIVSDSCYSGTITRGLDVSVSTPAARQRYLEKMNAGKSRTLMASGGDEPVADNGGGNHSVFASALLRGLTEMDKSDFTASELFRDYIQERVAGGANQTPEYSPLRNSGHESGDFVFIRTTRRKKITQEEAEVDYSQAFEPSQVTVKAKIFSSPRPETTEAARTHEVTGVVVLRVLLSSSGAVTDVSVVKGLPFGLTEKAMSAARKIQFTPAIKDGHSVSQWVKVEYTFSVY